MTREKMEQMMDLLAEWMLDVEETGVKTSHPCYRSADMTFAFVNATHQHQTGIEYTPIFSRGN